MPVTEPTAPQPADQPAETERYQAPHIEGREEYLKRLQKVRTALTEDISGITDQIRAAQEQLAAEQDIDLAAQPPRTAQTAAEAVGVEGGLELMII